MLSDLDTASSARAKAPQFRYRCSSCDKLHSGLPDLTFNAPDAWLAMAGSERGRHGHLSSDFCIIEDRDYFVRCVLEVPIIDGGAGLPEHFTFGVWGSLSLKSFNTYRMRDTSQALTGKTSKGKKTTLKAGPFFGWFSNRLTVYPDTTNLKCSIEPRAGTLHPLLILEPSDHPLSADSRNGMPAERAIELARTMPGVMVVIA